MRKKIEPTTKKISEYLELELDTVFSIPAYQRAYSWGTTQCDKLWQDIDDFMESNSKEPYFFGTIIINCQDNVPELTLIDGQQRTTTFLLLFKALLDKINVAIPRTEIDDDSVELLRKLRAHRRTILKILYKADDGEISDKPSKDNDIKIYNKVHVLENNSINEQYKDELEKILRAYDFDDAENNVTKIKYKRKDNRYTNFFRNYKFFHERIEKLSDSQLNNLSKNLLEKCEVIEIKSWQVEQAIQMFNSLNSDGLPLYDSDIISAQLYASAESIKEQDKFSELWEELCQTASSLEDLKIANLNAIFMQYMYYVRALNKETVNEKGSINVTTPGLRRYFLEINKDPIKAPIKMCDAMLAIANIWNKVSDYPLVRVLLKLNDNSKLFIASYFLRFNEEDITEEKITPIVECMVRLFSVLELTDYGYSSKNFKTFLFGEQAKFVRTEVDAQSIKQDFNNHINKNFKRKDLEVALEDYTGNSLVYLNEYLFAKNSGLPFSLSGKCDIEHIMPNSGKKLEPIREKAEFTDEEEFESYVNKIGNKVLLEAKINRCISNEWFAAKITHSLESNTGYVNSSYPIANALAKKYETMQKPYWTKSDIRVATNKASDRILNFIFQ